MGIIETVKEVAELVQKADNIVLIRQMLSLQTQTQEMMEENRRLKDKIRELESANELARTLAFKVPFYYAPGDEVPFCPRCWEGDKKVIHVVLIFRHKDTRWDCPNCKGMYLIKGNFRD